MSNEFIDRAQLDKLKARAMAEQAEREEKEAKKKANKAKRSSDPAKVRKPNPLVKILNGEFLTKEFIINNLGFIFFLMLLLMIIVGKGYYGKQITSRVVETQNELNEITGDYFDAKARLEENTQRVKLIERLEDTGLKETVNPTKVIRIKKDGGK